MEVNEYEFTVVINKSGPFSCPYFWTELTGKAGLLEGG